MAESDGAVEEQEMETQEINSDVMHCIKLDIYCNCCKDLE